MLELHEGLTETRPKSPKKKLSAKKPLTTQKTPSVLDDLINEINSMESTRLRNEAGKDKLIGGQGTRKGKLMLYQRPDGNFYMKLKGKEAEMDNKLVKNRSDAIKAAAMFAKMINAS